MPGLRVLTAGEALVDWICTERGAGLAAAGTFAKAAGGAPLNVAVGIARLGGRAAFAGRLGDDPFGVWLAGLMAAEGVDAARAAMAPGRPTRMAYVVTRADGERELAHFSAGAADEALAPADLPPDGLADVDAFVFGSLPLAAPTARAAILGAAAAVKARGGLVLFDPNTRPVLWPDPAALRAAVAAGLAVATVAKLGDDELGWAGADDADPAAADPAAAAEAVRARHGLDAVVVTRGAAGSLVARAAGVVARRGRPVEVVDATGAGDGFVAGLLTALDAGWRDLDDAGWGAALARANAVGALACTKAGAIAALPRKADLEAFLADGA